MATQLKHTDFTYTPPARRPNIRVAFIAGEAAIAVNEAKLPDATLEELAFRSDAEALVAAARTHLSPRMFDAFLRWGEVAVFACTGHVDDGVCAARSSLSCDAVRRVGGTDAQNAHDVMFKAFLTAIEAADCPAMGPLRLEAEARSGYAIESVIDGLQGDLPWLSPVCALINEVSEQAWALSRSRSAVSVTVGEILTAVFHDAQSTGPVNMDGYAPYMRGPLIHWQKAYAAYQGAASELATFDREVHTPAERKWTALSKPLNDHSPAAAFEASSAAAAELDVAQDRYDALLGIEGYAIDELLRLTAPGPSELAVKLQLFSKAYGWSLCGDPVIGEQITNDARRFGRLGALLQTDTALLDGFTARRREFETAYDKNFTPDEESAYYDRCDAHEAPLYDGKATTIEGVIAKLRVAFFHQTGQGWSDHAISDPGTPAFVDGLRLSDVFTRLAWSAVEDLARIGGVNLAEQGR